MQFSFVSMWERYFLLADILTGGDNSFILVILVGTQALGDLSCPWSWSVAFSATGCEFKTSNYVKLKRGCYDRDSQWEGRGKYRRNLDFLWNQSAPRKNRQRYFTSQAWVNKTFYFYISIIYKTLYEGSWPVGKESLAPLLDLPSQHLNHIKCQLSRKVWVSVVHISLHFFPMIWYQ